MVTFDEIVVAVAVLVAVCSFVVLVNNAVKAIKDWRNMVKAPTNERFEKVEDRVSKLESKCKEVFDWRPKVDEKLLHDYEFQQDEAEFNKLMLKSIKQLLQHEIDGNDKDGLISMEKEIDNFLLRRAQ